MKTTNYFQAVVFIAMSLFWSPLKANETVLPDFTGAQSEFSVYQTRITTAMLQGPNFAKHYTIITIGCGTECLFGYIANNRTGELDYFPFGGEEHSQMQLEFDITSNAVLVSFQNNPITETPEGWKTLYDIGETPCVAKKLQYNNGKFVEEVTTEIDRYGRACPLASDLFNISENGLSQFEEDCFTEFTRMNICAKAIEVSNAAKELFPHKVDAELTILSLRSVGSSLTMIARWELSAKELDQRLAANGLTFSQISNVLMLSAKNNACQNEALSAFIRLGGEVNYKYITKDYFNIVDIKIDSCL